MAATFDAPSGEACVARRDVSNTPLQALTLMNDVAFIEAAQAAGRQAAKIAGSDADRVRILVRRFLVRPPTDDEVKLLTAFVVQERTHLAWHPAATRKLAGAGPGHPAERAAWTALARVLMNTDEFVVKN
jgi:hypothetical protein